MAELHPGWELTTLQCTPGVSPDPRDFPLLADLWPLACHGAQLAELVRYEYLYTHGGISVDADIQPLRQFDPLLWLPAFTGWEDESVVCPAVFGCERGHPALKEAMASARGRIESRGTDWRTGAGVWSTGPGVFTEVMPGRDDVLVLPREAFFPVHYDDRASLGSFQRDEHPWAFTLHWWAGSWLDR